jgi:protein required for attachment to host cells
MDETDWHRKGEADFAVRVAEWTAARHRREPAAAIIVAAPPQMLGDLRGKLPAEVSAKIVGEIAKDLVKLPTDQLERALLSG